MTRSTHDLLNDLLDEAPPPEELQEMLETFATVARSAPAARPAASLRAGLLAATRAPVLAYAERVARLVQIAVDDARGLLERARSDEGWVMVLRGGVVTDDGTTHEAGDLIAMPAGSQHAFRSAPGEELLYLAIVEEGVDFAPSGGPTILAIN